MKASERQEGGDHYRSFEIQPTEFCQRNQLNFCESNAIKYVCRHRMKNGAEDIRKAIHYLELLLEFEYECEKNAEFTPQDRLAAQWTATDLARVFEKNPE